MVAKLQSGVFCERDRAHASTSQAEAVSFFMIFPQKSHSIASFILCWSEQSPAPAQFQREGT